MTTGDPDKTRSPREPRQDRSRASTERVLAAVLELASGGSLEPVTVAAVAGRAGVSVGAIYGRFGDKTGLVMAAQERFLATVSADVGARIGAAMAPVTSPDVDPAQVVRAVVSAAVDAFGAHEGLIRAFSSAARTTPALAERAEVATRALFEQVLLATEPHHGRFGHPDPAAALDVLFRILISVAERRVESADFISGRPVSWDTLGTELAGLATSYLRIT